MNRPDLAQHLCWKHEAPIIVLGFEVGILRGFHATQHWPRRGLPLAAWRPWLRPIGWYRRQLERVEAT